MPRRLLIPALLALLALLGCTKQEIMTKYGVKAPLDIEVIPPSTNRASAPLEGLEKK